MSATPATPRVAPPALVQAEFDALVGRARAAGYPLHDVPRLEVARNDTTNRALPRPPGESTVIRLSAATIAADAADRTWTMAHELCHVLGYQAGERRGVTRWERAAAWAMGTAAVASLVAALLTTGLPPLSTEDSSSSSLFLLAALGLAVAVWAVVVHPVRAEERRCDRMAARLFGQVLSETGVQRIRETEGAIRFFPNMLLTHPHPRSRRRAGQREAHKKGGEHVG